MSSVEEISIRYEEDGIETVKELDKNILSKGAWTTIIFRFQEWNKSAQSYGPVKYSIRRYQKRNDQYWMKSKFNISSDDQARKIIEVLTQWMNGAETSV